MSLLEKLQTVYQEGSDLHYKERMDFFARRMDELVDERPIGEVLQTYRTIEEANDGESLQSELLHYNARDAFAKVLQDKASAWSHPEKAHFWETTVVYRNSFLDSGVVLAKKLQLPLTSQRLDNIQRGLLLNCARPDQFFLLQERYGVPVTETLAREYADRAFTGRSAYIVWKYALQLAEYKNIQFTNEEKDRYVKTMVQNRNYKEAIELAKTWGFDTHWIEKAREAMQEQHFYDTLNGKASFYGFDSQPAHLLERLPHEEENFEKLIEKCVDRTGYHCYDRRFMHQWPEHVAKLLTARVCRFYQDDDSSNKAEQVRAITEIIMERPELEHLLTDKDIRAFGKLVGTHIKQMGSGLDEEKCDFLYEYFLYGYLLLREHTSFNPSQEELEEVFLHGLRESTCPFAILGNHYQEVRQFSEDFKGKAFAIVKEKAKEQRYTQDIIEFASILGQEVTPELYREALLNVRGIEQFVKIADKHGTQWLSAEEKKEIYNKITQDICFHGDAPKLDKAAQHLDQPLDKSLLLPVLERYVMNRETPLFPDIVQPFWDKWHIGKEIILRGYLDNRCAKAAIEFAQQTHQDIAQVVDYFVEHRDDPSWNNKGAAHRTFLDEAIVDAAVEGDQMQRFVDGLLEKKDVDWFVKLLFIARGKESVRVKVMNAIQNSAHLVANLQHELVAEERWEDAEILLKILHLPPHPALVKHRTQQN